MPFCRSQPPQCLHYWHNRKVRWRGRRRVMATNSVQHHHLQMCVVCLRSAVGLWYRAGSGSPDQPTADGGRGRQSQVGLCLTSALWSACTNICPLVYDNWQTEFLAFSFFSWVVSLCLCSSSSLAVVECVGALAKLHPTAFITKLIPRLKAEIFSGKWIYKNTVQKHALC